ncbi:MAG: hypothetical protein LQ349_006634 [Xanthoria aureola]|nr:MAG: hypothetical protein LQ349_006634 [Xanthoria aureola]
MLKGLTSEQMQKFCMRGKIFEMINRELISARSFGVSQSEHDLKDFEISLEGSKALSHSALAEWRSRTIECGASLGEKSKGPGETSKDVLDFMDPYVSATTVASAVSLDLLKKTMGELCDKAYSLSLLLRRSKKATFQIWTAKAENVVTGPVEANVSCQEFDGPAKAEILGSRAVMTIFGGLVKVPGDTAGGQIVLERSHVVCSGLMVCCLVAEKGKEMIMRERKRIWKRYECEYEPPSWD